MPLQATQPDDSGRPSVFRRAFKQVSAVAGFLILVPAAIILTMTRLHK